MAEAHVVPLGNFTPPCDQVEHTAAEQGLIDAFGKLYYDKWAHGQGLSTIQVSWLGYETLKCPLDLWIYQELIVREKPDYIVELGTRFGGSALFMGTICDLIGHGMVVSVDSDYTVAYRRPLHRRVVYVEGSTVEPATLTQVTDLTGTNARILLILDSDHTRDHVLREMRMYQHLVQPGGYMIVEDSNINGHPTYPEYGPGPYEAVEAFLAEQDAFEIDRGCERFMLTMNPRGYLRRKMSAE